MIYVYVCNTHVASKVKRTTYIQYFNIIMCVYNILFTHTGFTVLIKKLNLPDSVWTFQSITPRVHVLGIYYYICGFTAANNNYYYVFM